MRPLRIGVNALYLIPGRVGGSEIYLRSLLSALAAVDGVNHYVIFTNRETGPDLVPSHPNFTLAAQPVRASFRPARILWEQFALPVEAGDRRLDVMFNPGFTCPLLCTCPAVTVFFDLQHKRYPEHFRWFDLPFWRMLLYSAAHHSTLLIAISESTRRDLTRFYRLREDKIVVIPLGVDTDLFELGRRRRVQTGQAPYLLAVSTLHPHKNLDTLMRAFSDFHRSHSEYRLVIAGMRGFYAEPLEQLRASLGLATSVTFTGWIPRSELYDLFLNAAAFFYPSTFEGFGLPVLEALAAGVPMACSNIEPLAGIAGDAALQFDPHDTAAMVNAMSAITSDFALRERLAAAGPARAAQFSWTQTAIATLAALVRAATASRQLY